MAAAAFDKCFLLCALCLLCCAACVEARRSHRRGGGQHELFIFREQCALKDEPGPCKALKERFFFNITSGHCETFEYGGCAGNENNFLSLEECEEMCVVSEDKNPCHLPEAPGPCRGLVSRYLFDSEIQQCRHFFYGGCFGNANNFRSMVECRKRCQNPDKVTEPTSAPKMENTEVRTHAARRVEPVEPTVAVGKLTEGRAEPQVQHNKTEEQYNKDVEVADVCLIKPQRGHCDGAEKRFAYNPATRRCHSFQYSGCGGNQNNFIHRRHCIKTCVLRNKDLSKRPRKDHRGMMSQKMIRIRKKNLDKYGLVSV